jgi:hypothetical protein
MSAHPGQAAPSAFVAPHVLTADRYGKALARRPIKAGLAKAASFLFETRKLAASSCRNLHPLPPNLSISQVLPARLQIFPQLPIGELLSVRRKRLRTRPIRQAGQPNATRPNVTPRGADFGFGQRGRPANSDFGRPVGRSSAMPKGLSSVLPR